MTHNASVMLTLSGLGEMANHRILLFLLTALCYCVIWVVNVTIIVTIIVDKNLHGPMYVFLCNLCVNGLYGTTGFYPKFLKDILSTTQVISLTGCLVQGFVLHSSACADFSFLALMAYDRYVAICRPLSYHSVMTKRRITIFVFFAWLVPLYLVFMSSITVPTSRLCGLHVPKVYCVTWLIHNIACTTSIAKIVVPAFNYTFYFCHFLLIFWSYLYLIKTCKTSKEGRTKFMQTCVPHVVCLLTMTGCLLFDLLYMRFGSKRISQNLQNFMAIEFLLIPPIANPVIYGLKLTKIRNRIKQYMSAVVSH